MNDVPTLIIEYQLRSEIVAISYVTSDLGLRTDIALIFWKGALKKDP